MNEFIFWVLRTGAMEARAQNFHSKAIKCQAKNGFCSGSLRFQPRTHIFAAKLIRSVALHHCDRSYSFCACKSVQRIHGTTQSSRQVVEVRSTENNTDKQTEVLPTPADTISSEVIERSDLLELIAPPADSVERFVQIAIL